MSAASSFSLLRITAALALAASVQVSIHAGAQPSSSQTGMAARSAIQARAAASYARLPLSFVPNRGQASDAVRFEARGKGYAIALAPSGAALKLKAGEDAIVRMEFDGANAAPALSGERQLAGKANFLIGSDPAKWHTNVPTFGAVRYAQIYAGTDLLFYGNQGQLEYDFVLAANADPNKIRMRFAGADALRIEANGDLAIGAAGADVAFHKPVVYQEIGGRRRAVRGEFALLDNHTAGFRLGRYDHSKPLVIDPTLVYSTYLGGSGLPGDLGYGVAVDKSGNAYVTGEAESTDFPFSQGISLTNSPNPDSAHVFVSKFNTTGTDLVWSTYIGGTYDDHARAIVVDSNLCAYVTGYTFSYDYPATVGAFMTSNPSPSIGAPFVSKLTPAGDGLVYSTFLGGSGLNGFGDEALAIAVDANLNAYVTGETYSTDFPTTQGAYQTKMKATNGPIPGTNAFLTKLEWDGKSVVYSTYIGGSGAAAGEVGDIGQAVAFDASGNAYIAGLTYSSNYPVTSSAFQKINKGYAKGNYNAFVTKMNATGTALVYSTFLGGTGIAYDGDQALGVAVDKSGDAFVVGQTFSTEYPVTAGAFQTHSGAANNASSNAFITKLNPTGSGLIYSTFLGGIGNNEEKGDAAVGIGLDANGNAYIAGSAYSGNFPVTANALQSGNYAAHHAEENPFISVINAAGSQLLFSTYLGGSGDDIAKGMATDGAGNVYLTGQSYSTDFPVTKSAFQTSNLAEVGVNAGTNAFVAKVNIGAVSSTTATTTALTSSANPAAPGASVTFTATVKASTGTAVPAGSVVFSVDGVSKATVTLAAGVAKFSTSTLAAGTHTVKASYNGNTTFGASSGTLSETIKAAAAAPKFTPAPGLYAPNQIVKLATATAGATIYYTTTGATPTTASLKYTTAGIKLTKTTTIKAIAVKTGLANSPLTSGIFTIKPAAPKPTLTPGAETFHGSVNVKLKDTATTGLILYYTTNGAAPTTASAKYNGAGITLTKTTTIKAMALATGYSKSAVASATYTSN